ncbi:hypothetical protein OOZ15_13535 [Galbibacter sp. EGI 63066]|uniref:hypothetical protein n=1 Tax=Galbibacter sp. EGI 63066 TaxID=2993559 RepID=UPI002248E151|nr:hypothetical protein [Galbibacter sp. EGI 63066]MCX2680970.1 hypothetical protein [Galbibacter sp. EGI 63066]
MDGNPYSKFEDLAFSGNTVMTLKSSDFEEVEFKEGKVTYLFSNCTFDSLRIENTEDIDFKDISIFFSDCCIGDIKIEDVSSPNISVLFDNCMISGIVKKSNIRLVNLTNCFINGVIFLQDLKKVHVSFDKRHRVPTSWNNNPLTRRDFRRELIAQKQSYIIDAGTEVVYHVNIRDDRNDPDQKARDIQRLTNEERNKLNIFLDLRYSPDQEHYRTRVEHALLSGLSISGNANGELKVERSGIDRIYIHSFSVSGRASFFGIKPSGTDQEGKIHFEIRRSNLDNVWFDNVSFKEYDLVSFFQSSFGLANFTSCGFPDKYDEFEKFISVGNIHYPEVKEDNNDRNRYEIFLQLKKRLESSGNFFEAQKLHSVANEALLKIKDVSKWDKFILGLNSISNNHGTSIKHPLGWMFLFSVCLYILYLLSIDRIFINTSFDWNLIGYYFSFLDITHRIDFLVGKKELTGWSVTIDWINKIVTGFLIYQFIAAFRKYGKR